jgi:Glycosyl hydrolases family 28
MISAGLMAAGTTLSSSMAGCGVELNIPCLGPAAAPTPVAGMTYVRASEIGCALDCNLQNGRNKGHGGAATDDGPRINAAMAGATEKNPITLIIDGSALISGLFLPAGGNWSIAGLGCGTGFFLKTGTNNDGIHNGPPNAAVPSDPGPPAPARGANVSLSNFTLNGNQGNGHSGDSTTGAYQGITGDVFYFGINLMNLNNITIEKVVVVNSPSYHFRFSNTGHVTVSGCLMRSAGYNTDGLHFDGPANDITISDCSFSTGDDSIALNCPEGHGGDISRVAVSRCTFNSWSLMRLYTVGAAGRFKIDTVNVSNCTGTLSELGFFIGLFQGSYPSSIDGLMISDCKLTAPILLGMAENFGVITVSNVTFVPSNSNVIYLQPQTNETCSLVRRPPDYSSSPYLGSSLSFVNCTMSRSANVDAVAVILEDDSTINNLVFNGFTVQDAGSYSPLPELLNLESGSIEQLVLDALDSSNIKTPVSAGGFSDIGTVSGVGVLATGWEFPDAVMANGVPYISATTGLPSIKVNGVVEPDPEA